MKIDVASVVRAHAYLRCEAPPAPWQPDADDATFFPLLGEMIVAGLTRGNELGELTLSFANVRVEPSAADPMPEGDLVAVTIRSRGDWTPERTWSRDGGTTTSPFVTRDLETATVNSDVVYAYTRQFAPDEGSITVMFRRASARSVPRPGRTSIGGVPDVRVIPFLVSELRLSPDEQELLQREWWPSYAHAVVNRDGVFLFDNGVGFGNAEIESTFSPRVTAIEDALAEHGISLADVTGVANCHLHFDHCGQNARIPTGVPIFVQRTEWAMVHEPDYTVPEWIDVPGLSYELLEGEIEVAPGLRLIPTPGHTAGHQSLVLDASDGTVVLAGQAAQSRAEWEGANEPSVSGASTARDPRYPSSVERLRSFDPVRVHFAHDPAVWQR